MFRQSMGGRLLAIVLAGVMTFNCNSVTAFAKNSLATSVEVQAEEETSQEEAALSEEAGEDASSAEESGSADETVEESSQAETEEMESEEETEEVSEETAEEETSEEEVSEEEASVEETSEEASEDEEDPEEASTESATEEVSGEAGAEGASATDASEEDGDSNEAAAEETSEENAAAAETEEAATAETSEENAAAEATEAAAAEATTAEAAKVEEVRVEKTYIYEDGEIYVVATLDDAKAVPDDAKLTVTPVYASSSDYDYDAYMDALNANGEDKEYNADNTLLYDVAFLYEEKDAEGKGTGRTLEYQPDFGAVKISISFKQDQLGDQIGAEEENEVEIHHLPLTDSVRDSVDTTADAKNLSEDDIRVESVQNEQIDVDGENVEFKVSGLSVVSVSKPLKAPARGGAVTGKISFFNDEATAKAPFEPANEDDYFILVTLKEKEGENAGEIAGWGIQQISAAELSGQMEFEFSVSDFYDYGEDGTTTDTPLEFDADRYSVSSRLFHTVDFVSNYQEAIAQDDNIPGYTFMGRKYGANASNSSANPATINLLKKTKDDKFYIQIQADAAGNISSAGDYFIAVKAERESGESYYCAPFTISAGDFDAHNKLDIPITEWTDADGKSDSQHFSTNWKSFQVIIAARKPEKKNEPITPKRCIGGDAQNFVDQVSAGGLLGEFTLVEYAGVTEATKTVDPLGDEEWRYVLKLGKVKLEPAVTPHDILGEAANFGIVADAYNQKGHTETNFAVNSFSSDANIDVDGAGNTPPALFYVGSISGQLKPTERNTTDLEIHTPESQFGNLKMGDVNTKVYVYDTDAADIASYVSKLQSAGRSKAAELLAKDSIAPVNTTGQCVLDISGLEDNKTVYVNADGIADAIANKRLTIKKRPGQSIVFNYSTSGEVKIGEFTVITLDSDGNVIDSIKSTTIPYGDDGGGKDANKKSDDIILRHITFNCANASSVAIKDASGLFLCPNANTVSNENGAGWILAKGTVSSDTEWHFFFHDRKNKTDLKFQLKGAKVLVDKDGNPIGYEDKGFRFNIFEEGADGKAVGTPLYSAVAKSDGTIEFERIQYVKEDVPLNSEKVFKYIIKEDTTGCELKDGKYYKDGIEYAAEEKHIEITCGNLSNDVGRTFLTVKMKVDGEIVHGDLASVFKFGKFTNKKTEEDKGSLKIKKSFTGLPQETNVDDLEFKITDPDGKETTITYADFDENGEYVIGTDLPAGDEYKVEETNAGSLVEHYILKSDSTTEGSGTVVKDEVTTIELANHYEKTKISVSKVDITDSEEIAGAHIQIIDSKGSVVEQWDSTTEAHVIEGLKVGEPYTLRETVAPDGYTIATDTTFTIDETGEVTSSGPISDEGVLLVEDSKTKVKISKTDITGDTELPGATIEILDKDGNVVKIDNREVKWTSTDKPHEIEGLTTGVEYTLRETVAPNGYTIASDTKFTLNADGTIDDAKTTAVVKDGVLLVKDDKTKVSISKKAVNGEEELPGATIQILDKDGNVVTIGNETLEWTSGTTPKEIEGLTTGVEYTLHEEAAPNGYKVASDIKFTIGTDGKVTAGGKEVKDGLILIEDALTEVSISKKAVGGEEELPGATIQIRDKDGNVVKIGNETLEWTSGTTPKEIKGLTTGVEYTLHEEVAPGGYTIATDTKFVLKADGTIDTEKTTTKTENGILLIEDAKKAVGFSKRAVTGEAELPGARLQILDENGEVVVINGTAQEWTSTDKPYQIEGLPAGNYTMREVTAPAGYVVTTDITFTVDENCNVTACSAKKATDPFGNSVVIMEDALTEVSISKKAVGGEEELPGATIQIRDKDGNVVKIGNETLEWTSGTAPKEIKGLTAGVEYTLHEEAAPNGYKVASDITFTIEKDGTVKAGDKVVEGGLLLINDALTEVSISKKAVGGEEELPGATIQIRDKDGNVVKIGNETLEWTSGTAPKEIKGLTAGVEYTLHEEAAPNGYKVASDIKFTIEKDGTVKAGDKTVEGGLLLIEDALTSVKISKKDIANGNELPGATIQIRDKDGNVVKIGNETLEWTSTTEPKEIKGLTAGVEYTLHEEVAPNGYTVATDTTFTIDKTGKVTTSGSTTQDGALLINDAKTLISVSKTDITGEKELAGATIQILDKDGKVVEIDKKKLEWTSTNEPHMIEGLTTGVEYTLHETVAPAGYKIAADTKFVLNADGSVNAEQTTAATTATGKLLVKDEQTEVQISKTDITGDKELKGAHIEIYKGNEFVEGWDSEDGGKPHMIKGLTTGVEYTLRETVAPDGYTIATDTKFTLKADGTIDDAKTTAVVKDGVLLVKDDKTKVSISKKAVNGEEELPGATIQILDDKGNVVELGGSKLEWTSGTTPKEIEGLTTGVEYTLHEEAAPNGYKVASDIKFTIGTDGKVTAGGKEVKDGLILIEDALTSVSISKTDIDGSEEIPGATIQIRDDKGNVVKIGNENLEWTSGTTPKEIKGLTAGVEYTLHEEVAPNGYTIASDIKFTISKDGKVTAGGKEVDGGKVLIKDALTKVKVSKTDITGDTELPGATIEILDKDGKVVKIDNKEVKWTSTDKPYEIEGLTTGVEYTLRETVAPNGYKVATDTKFQLNADGTIDTKNTTADVKDGVLLVKDDKTVVTISKTDITGEEELAGATIQILDKDGNVVEIDGKPLEWTSEADDESTEDVNEGIHKIEGLTAGVKYTLHEETAPNGYKVASDIEFTIDKDGNVTAGGKTVQGGLILINDELTSVKISKTDITGEEELAGATIQILDSKGNVVELDGSKLEWTSTEEAKEIKGLSVGETYTLRETAAPDGYTVASDISFTIDKFGNVESGDKVVKDGLILIQDELTKVRVSKTDIADGKELEGAKIQILDKDGNVVKIDGQAVEWISAKEPHLIEGLTTGVEYTLHEEVAPNGYTIATDTAFTIDEKGKVTTKGSITEDGILLIEDAITRIKVSKVDIANGEEIEGAKIEIVYTDKDGKEKVFEKWTSTTEAHTVEGLTTGVEYTLRETVAPDGYTVAAETKFTLDEKGNVTTNATVNSDGVILVEDAMTKIHVSKVDIADGEELEGAHIQIIDKKGNVVEEWDSTKEAHEIIGLKTGEEYTLRETVAPEGHVLTTDTKFTIDEKGNVTSSGSVTEDGVLLVEDAKTSVKVSKVDIADGKELVGAHIQIIEKDKFGNETVVEEWDSTKKPHMIEGLKTGVEYTLRETVAPEGHILTTDTTFTIDQKGKVTTTGTISKDGVILVEDAKTSVKVSKTDIANGKEVEGAKIQIIEKDKNGKETVVEEWISSKKPHEIEGLKTNVEYTLRETVAPDGYTVATDTTFTIDENGKVTTTGTITEKGILLVEDAKTVIKVSKTDIANGEEIAGAKIEILDKNGKVVEKWTSKTEPHTIIGLKTGEEYTLRETVAPDGYAITTDTKFSIDQNGKVTSTGSVTKDGVLLVEDAKTVVKVKKTDIANGEELEGAHIQIIIKGPFGKETVVEEWDSTKDVHEIVGLKTGVEYILRETVAPNGYAITTDTTFKLDEAGNVTSSGTVTKDGVLLVEDAKTEVKVSKVDIANGKELPGAKIQIIDENGKVVAEWVSTQKPHVIKGLKTGVKYTLRETVAPNGYEIATDTTFTIDKYGKVTTTGSMTKDGIILIKDKKKAAAGSKKSGPAASKHGSSRTGDDANALLWLILALASAGSLIFVFRKRRNNQ